MHFGHPEIPKGPGYRAKFLPPPRALITHGQPPRVSRRFRENLNSGSIFACVFRSAFLQLALGHGSKVLFLIDFHQETWSATHFCPLLFRNVLPRVASARRFLMIFHQETSRNIFSYAPPPLPSSRRGPPKMRRGCTASAGVPGSSWRPFPEHSSLPPPSTQRPTGPKRPTARERGGRGKKVGNFPDLSRGQLLGNFRCKAS